MSSILSRAEATPQQSRSPYRRVRPYLAAPFDTASPFVTACGLLRVRPTQDARLYVLLTLYY